MQTVEQYATIKMNEHVQKRAIPRGTDKRK